MRIGATPQMKTTLMTVCLTKGQVQKAKIGRPHFSNRETGGISTQLFTPCEGVNLLGTN